MHQELRQVEKTGFIREGSRTSATVRIMPGHMHCGSLLPLKSPRHRSSLSAGANA
jgi:hypothetical protein